MSPQPRNESLRCLLCQKPPNYVHLFSTAKHGTFLEENITTTVDHRCHAKQRWSTIATTDGYHYHHPTPPPPHPTSRTTFAAQFKAFSLLRCASHRFDHPCSPSHPPPCRHRRPLSCSRRSPFHCSSSHSLLSLLPSTSHLPLLSPPSASLLENKWK